FFFQAEDGIRDKLVTGVQTCALPISSRLGGKLPLVLAAVKILVDAARDKAVEPANRLLQPTSFDVKHRCELGERGGARHRPRDGTADRAVGERISLEVLRVENQISREIGILMARRIE